MNKETIHLFCFRLENYASLLKYKDEYLTIKELGEAEKFVSPNNLYKLLSYLIRRVVLARYLNCKPAEVSFSYKKTGKAYLTESKPQFNVSHSQGWFLLGVTDNKEIGVDLEVIKDMPKLDSFIDSYVSPERKNSLLLCKGYEKLSLTYLDWCMKESFVKASSLGIIEDFTKLNYIAESSSSYLETNSFTKQFSWKIDNKAINKARSNMFIYSCQDELAIAVTLANDSSGINNNIIAPNIIHYKINPVLTDLELIKF